MRDFAVWFYKSQGWKKTRDAYAASVGGVCERCKEHGLITAGEIVHHIVPITPENIHDTEITLNHNNLKLVCRLCHAAEHEELRRADKCLHRYVIDEYGRVQTPETTP